MSTAPTLVLTDRQRQVLDYLRTFLSINHQLPSGRQIADDFSWRSANAAYEHLRALERRGALERNEMGNLMLSPAGLAYTREGAAC